MGLGTTIPAWLRSVLGLVLGVLIADSARADGAPTAALDWRGTAYQSCLDATTLVRDVERQLGRAVFSTAPGADLTVRVVLADASDEAIRARVELLVDGDVTGSRELVGERKDCAHLRKEFALVVSMLVDVPSDYVESQRAARPARAPAAKPAPAPRLEPPLDEAPSREPAPPPRRAPWRSALSAVGGLSAGTVPFPAFGAALAAVVAPPAPLNGRLAIAGWDGRSLSRERGTATFRALSASAGIGPPPLRLAQGGRMRTWAFVEAGVVWANAMGFATSLASSRGFSALGLAVRPELDVGRGWFLCVDADAKVMLGRPGFLYAGTSGDLVTLYRSGPFGADVAAGLGWMLP